MARYQVQRAQRKYQRRGSRYKAGSRKKIQTRVGSVTSVVNLSKQRNIFGFPDVLVTRLRYSDVYILTSTANAAAKQIMRMNSLFDPDFSNVGHQPLWLDQYDPIYQRYTVLGSKMHVEFAWVPNTSSTAQPSTPIVVGLIGDNDSTSSATVSTLMETSTGTSCLLSQDQTKSLTLTYSPEINLGLDNGDDTVGAAVSGNPSQAWFGTIYAAEAGIGSPTSIVAKVKFSCWVCNKLNLHLAQGPCSQDGP